MGRLQLLMFWIAKVEKTLLFQKKWSLCHTYHYLILLDSSLILPIMSSFSANFSSLNLTHSKEPWLSRSNGPDQLFSWLCHECGRNSRTSSRKSHQPSQQLLNLFPDGQRVTGIRKWWLNRQERNQDTCTALQIFWFWKESSRPLDWTSVDFSSMEQLLSSNSPSIILPHLTFHFSTCTDSVRLRELPLFLTQRISVFCTLENNYLALTSKLPIKMSKAREKSEFSEDISWWATLKMNRLL